MNKEFKPTIKKNSIKNGKIDEITFDQLKILWGKFAGKDFIYNENNKPVLNMLMAYFINDDRILDYDIDSLKGIMLIGKKGNGKTTIFEIFKRFMKYTYQNSIIPLYRNIAITSTERIKSSYLLRGNIEKYGWNSNQDDYHDPFELIINEFGVSYDFKIFGTPFNEIITSLMMIRYEIFTGMGKLTHITTNMDTEELKNIYDPILIDRFKEMFNIIELKGESWRK